MSRSIFRSALIATVLLASAPALAQNRVALVIGQSAYKAVTALPNPANDAKAMAQLLTDAGFDVTSTSDLSQTQLRDTVGAFAAKVAEKGPDTVALMFYAGHGLQIDGENYLVPVDIDPKRETDIPLQAVRLNDVLNTLTSVPTRMRFVLLDACRNNPFAELTKTAGRGLALVDTKTNVPGTLLSYSTAPGAEAEDGSGANSPYTTALLTAAREPGLTIEGTLKRVRLAVNKATDGRQTPWESSSLTDDFRFFATASQDAQASAEQPKQVATAQASEMRSVDDWKRELQGKPADQANDLIVFDGSTNAYEAYVSLYAQPPFAPQAQAWLDRHKRMIAWSKTVSENTSAGYRAFLVAYPDSDLTATARKLEERLRYKPVVVGVVAAPVVAPVVASLAPTCPCTAPGGPAIVPALAPAKKKADSPKRRAEPEPPKRVTAKPPRRPPPPDDDDVIVVRRAPPPDYVPVAPIIGGAIGGVLGGGGGGYGRPPGNYGGGPTRGGGYGRY